MTRGGFGSKVHLMTDGSGLPIGCVLTQGNRNECPVFDTLLEAALANTGGVLPARLAADRGYSADRIRATLSSMGVEPVIPYRRSEHVTDRPPLNGKAYTSSPAAERPSVQGAQRDRAVRRPAEGDASDRHAL
jgi:transposase